MHNSGFYLTPNHCMHVILLGVSQCICLPPAPIPSLKALVSAMAPVRDWFTLGIQLGVPDHRLDEVECNHPKDASRCKVEVLRHWLASTQRPSWQNLASALRSMDLNSLADSVEARASQQ